MRGEIAGRSAAARRAARGWDASVLSLGMVSFLNDLSSEMAYPVLPCS